MFMTCTLVLILSLGTWLVSREEERDIFTSFYNCVMTITTVGFGDPVGLMPFEVEEEHKMEASIFSLIDLVKEDQGLEGRI